MLEVPRDANRPADPLEGGAGASLLAGLPAHHFGCILADPPWNFTSWARSPSDHPHARSPDRHYRTMKLAEIKALPIRDLAALGGCHLFLWATGPTLPQALDAVDAWGFRYSGMAFTWIKLKKSFNANQLRTLPTADCDLNVGLGLTTRKNAEFCLLARRGNARRVAKDVREIILSPRREHSRKPEEARARIERYCAGPYLDLFGREDRAGWTVRGDQLGMFDR